MILHQHKIVFGGTMGAGKTTAIQALSEIPVLSTEVFNTDNVAHEKLLTTVGIDYGEITLDDELKIGLYGTPGQDRFDFMWPVICKGALGIVILVDHANNNALKDIEFFIDAFQSHGQNIVIGITHTDIPSHYLLTDYREWLKRKGYNYPLYAVDARKKDDIFLLVETLIANAEIEFLTA